MLNVNLTMWGKVWLSIVLIVCFFVAPWMIDKIKNMKEEEW